MEESPTQNPGDPGVEPSKEKASDGLYELDLDLNRQPLTAQTLFEAL